MKICINGGHYPGLDSGAVGAKLQEADVCKELMQRTASFLRAAGCEVLEVQENELYDITNASNNWGADIFISIHCNAATNLEAKGTETLIYSFGVDSERLAQGIQNQIVNTLNTVDRGMKERHGLYVLKYTDCPAALVETAFISNQEDEQLLIDKLDDFAAAIARGATDYFA